MKEKNIIYGILTSLISTAMLKTTYDITNVYALGGVSLGILIASIFLYNRQAIREDKVFNDRYENFKDYIKGVSNENALKINDNINKNSKELQLIYNEASTKKTEEILKINNILQNQQKTLKENMEILIKTASSIEPQIGEVIKELSNIQSIIRIEGQGNTDALKELGDKIKVLYNYHEQMLRNQDKNINTINDINYKLEDFKFVLTNIESYMEKEEEILRESNDELLNIKEKLNQMKIEYISLSKDTRESNKEILEKYEVIQKELVEKSITLIKQNEVVGKMLKDSYLTLKEILENNL